MAYHERMPSLIETDAAHRRAGRQRASWLEVFFGRRTGAFVALGSVDPDSYERFAVRKIMFPEPGQRRRPWRQSGELAANAGEISTDARNLVWLCFPGIDTADSLGRRYLFDRLAMIPQQGIAFVFHGPAGIAGYSPEQCRVARRTCWKPQRNWSTSIAASGSEYSLSRPARISDFTLPIKSAGFGDVPWTSSLRCRPVRALHTAFSRPG